jgi:hypothetical protein
MRTLRSVRRRCTAAVSVALLATMLAVPGVEPAAAKVAACTSPPPVFPIDKVANGKQATGWTVLQGTTPESFTVTMLGVLQDALGPGRDAILVRASGANIDAIGGMGPGFSGSPVYRNDQLVGSVSYELGGDAHYGALTPGQDLVNVLLEPKARTASPQRIRLTRSARTLIARDAGVRLARVSNTLSQIPLPLAVPDVSADRIAQVTDRFAKRGISVVPYTAGKGSSSASVDDTRPIEPGDVFVAALSYGAVPYAALGTATIACGDYVVAFGHYFTHAGSGVLGAMLDGNIVATIPAGNDYWPFKEGNIGTLHGTLEQDRLAGVRGIAGTKPALTEVHSSITNLDTGRVSDSTTQVASRSWLAGVASDHAYYVVHSVLDAHRGTTDLTWTVVVRSHGVQYDLEFHNAYYGGRAVWGAANDIYGVLRSIERADGPARIVSVDMAGTVTEQRLVAKIHRARTASTTAPTFALRDTIRVHAGDTLSVRVPLVQSDTGDVHVAQTSFAIPANARRDGYLAAEGGQPDYWLGRGLSLDRTIAKLLAQPSTLDLSVQLRLGGHRMTQYLRQSLAPTGEDEVNVNVVRG